MRRFVSHNRVFSTADETLTRYAFGVLSDYIPSVLATVLREHSGIKMEPVVKSNDKNIADVKVRAILSESAVICPLCA